MLNASPVQSRTMEEKSRALRQTTHAFVLSHPKDSDREGKDQYCNGGA